MDPVQMRTSYLSTVYFYNFSHLRLFTQNNIKSHLPTHSFPFTLGRAQGGKIMRMFIPRFMYLCLNYYTSDQALTLM